MTLADLRFDEKDQGNAISYGGAGTMEGVVSTRRANGINWLPLIGQDPSGSWTFAFADTPEFRDHFAKGRIEDVLFVVGYSGDTPPWPQ